MMFFANLCFYAENILLKSFYKGIKIRKECYLKIRIISRNILTVKINQFYSQYFSEMICNSVIVQPGRPNGAVVREAGCCTSGSWFESRVRLGCRAVRPWLHQQLRSKTGRREVPGSIPCRACRPSRSEFPWFSPKLA